MGAFRFERVPSVDGARNIIEFDSSYDRAIATAFGWELGSVELRETSRRDDYIIYDVYARTNRGDPDDPPTRLEKRGVLSTMTKSAINDRLDSGNNFSRRFPNTEVEKVDAMAAKLGQARRREYASS